MTTTQEDVDLEKEILELAQEARQASLTLSTVPPEKKNEALLKMGELILEKREEIKASNAIDIENGQKNGLSKAMLDRLVLTDKRIDQMVEGLKQIAELPDPVGEMIEEVAPSSGIKIQKRRVPIGVIGIIYESRPNVTIDCAALCLKSGNAAILRGGKEAFHSNTALIEVISEALQAVGLPEAALILVPTTDRQALNVLLKLDDLVHAIIPRGGEGLIRFVAENSRIPVIKHYKGVCSLFVDSSADLEMALRIAINGKCQRPGVCNALENLLVHKDVVDSHLVPIADALSERGVELRIEPDYLPNLKARNIAAVEAGSEDFYEEYLDLILSIKIVNSTEEAIAFINEHGSSHSDAIVTEDESNAEAFLNSVDSATVYWNASTRFTDGFQFGLGAEIGISTDRLHARGPMGLRELCTYKYVIKGKGEIVS